MKINCLRESLLTAITIVLKAVSNRTTLPILECILLKAENNEFCLTGNDLELGIKSAPIESEIDEEGSVALEAKLFSEIVRRCEGERVYITVEEENNTTIVCGKSKFHIMGQNGDEFPGLPDIERNHEYKISQLELRNMIRQTIFSVSLDETRPVLTGEFLEIREQDMNMVAVDGYRISYKKGNVIQSSGSREAVIPGKTLMEISKILSQEADAELCLYFTDKHVLMEISGALVLSRLIEGEYIKYSQSFSEDYKTQVKVDRSKFIASLERACLVSFDSKKNPVKLEVLQDKMILTSQADINQVREELEIETTGENLEIAFNPKYLIDALKVIDDDQTLLLFTTSLSPCVIRPLEGRDYQYLILPLRL